MSDKPEAYAVSKEHAYWFGVIVSEFARAEHRMVVATAGILNTDMGTAVILLGDMQFRQKRQTLQHLNTTLGVNGIINQELRDALDDLRKRSSLRNQIAHAIWKKGRRPGAIKPVQLLLRGEEPEPLGHHHNERDYTVAELEQEARSLVATSKRIWRVVQNEGLQARVEAKIAEIKASTSVRQG